MAHYGLEHSLGLGDLNAGVLRNNQEISRINSQRLAKYQSGKASDIAKSKLSEEEQGVSLGTEALGQALNKGDDLKKVGQAAKSLKGKLSGVNEGMSSEAEESFTTDNPIADLETHGSTLYKEAMPADSLYTHYKTPTIIPDDVKAGLPDTGEFVQAVPAEAEVVTTGEDIAKGGISGAARVAGGALSVGLGGFDLAEDLANKKIAGANDLEKAGNITQIGSGGLEAAAGGVAGVAAALEGVGAAADLTGFAAPAGLVLGVLGGVAGLVSAGLSFAGGIKEDIDKKDKPPTASPQLLSQQAIVASGTTGAEVKQ